MELQRLIENTCTKINFSYPLTAALVVDEILQSQQASRSEDLTAAQRRFYLTTRLLKQCTSIGAFYNFHTAFCG